VEAGLQLVTRRAAAHRGAEYLAHCHDKRPHQSLENEPLVKPKKRGRPSTKRGKIEEEIVPLAQVRCSKRKGGLLKSYSRRTARLDSFVASDNPAPPHCADQRNRPIFRVHV
jgi:hypothetical protein